MPVDPVATGRTGRSASRAAPVSPTYVGDTASSTSRSEARSARRTQEHRLLAADGDHDRLRVHLHALVDEQVPRDQVVDDPLGPAVLEQRAADGTLVVPQIVGEVTGEAPQVAVQVLDLVELLVRAAGG